MSQARPIGHSTLLPADCSARLGTELNRQFSCDEDALQGAATPGEAAADMLSFNTSPPQLVQARPGYMCVDCAPHRRPESFQPHGAEQPSVSTGRGRYEDDEGCHGTW